MDTQTGDASEKTGVEAWESRGTFRGPQGIEGPEGSPGAPGVPGTKGAAGGKGSTGDTGPEGPQGQTGPQGPRGEIGPAGASGAAGAQGPEGATGAAGATGAQGPQGTKGDTGEPGATGAQGPQGVQGIQGDTGPNGATGPQGAQGIQGLAGAAGAAGATGTTGATGAAGTNAPAILTGSGAPAGGTGAVGDFHFDTSTGDLREKTGGSTWTTRVNLSQVNIKDQVVAGSIGAQRFVVDSNVLNDQTGTTYTLVAGDNGKVVTLSNASAITVTLPASLAVGYSVTLIQKGAGQVTISPASTTMRHPLSHTRTSAQYAAVNLFSHVSNDFVLTGDTAP